LRAYTFTGDWRKRARPAIRKTRTGDGFRTPHKVYSSVCTAASGVVIVLLTRSGSVSAWLDRFQFGIAAWGYNRISINIFTTAGFYIFVTALACYPFRSKQAEWPAKDFVVASKRSGRSLSNLAVGSAAVFSWLIQAQIAQLGKILASGGKFIYRLLSSRGISRRDGVWSGLPGIFFFHGCKFDCAHVRHYHFMVLVGIILVVTMGPPKCAQATQIALALHFQM